MIKNHYNSFIRLQKIILVFIAFMVHAKLDRNFDGNADKWNIDQQFESVTKADVEKDADTGEKEAKRTPKPSTYLMILNGLDHGDQNPSAGVKILASILNIGTKLCCIVTLLCLVICVWVFSAYKSLYSLRNTIHRNLCISLLLAEFFFLLGLHGFNIKTNRLQCRAIAILLHYLFLCAYCWMFLEAYLIYRQIICVFATNSYNLLLFYAVGYILPAIIVGIMSSIWWPDYGTDLYCWINFKSAPAWILVAPVVIIFAVNLMVLIGALAVLLRQNSSKIMHSMASERPSMESTEMSKNLLTNRRRHFLPMIKGSVSLLCLLGLGWAFGFLTTVYTQGNILAVLFTTLMCIQGIFIFVMHVLLNQKVRQTVWNSVNNRCPHMKAAAITIFALAIFSFLAYHLVVKFVL